MSYFRMNQYIDVCVDDHAKYDVLVPRKNE